jgi:hypothetical protein
VRRKTVRYKNRKGQSSTKTKETSRTRSIVRLRLRVKPNRYRHLERIKAEAPRAVRLPEGADRPKLTVTADSLSLRARVGDGWAGDPLPVAGGPKKPNATHVVAMMFLSLYQILNLSRAMDKARPAGGVR